MWLPVSTISISISAILLFILSVRVIDVRRSANVSIGDNGNELLQRRIRGQANLVEYAPIGILLILIAELQSANWILLGLAALAFLAGRIMHGYAFGFTDKAIRPRRLGMQLTLFSILGLVGVNLLTLIIGAYS